MSSGKLKVDKEKLQDTSRYWVGKVFSDEAEYGRQVDKIMKNTDRMFVRNNLGAPKQDPVKKTSKNDTQTAAVSNAQNMDAALAQQLAQVLEGGRFNVSV